MSPSTSATGNPIPQLGFISNAAGEDISMLQKLNTVVTDLGFQEYTQTDKSMFDVFAITGALMFGTAGLPHVIIRFFTVPSAKAARLSAGWALIFIAALYTTAPAVGAFARINFIDTVNEATYITDDENYETRAAEIEAAGGKPVPTWYKTWEKTGLLQYEDKNGDGRVQYYDDSNEEFAAKAARFGYVTPFSRANTQPGFGTRSSTAPPNAAAVARRPFESTTGQRSPRSDSDSPSPRAVRAGDQDHAPPTLDSGASS